MAKRPADRAFHPVVDIFPRMSDDEFAALVEDIRQHGLHEPIWVDTDGRIIDGRHRYLACRKLGVEPTYRTWAGEGSLIDFVVSANLRRRHLSASQAALAAARAREYYQTEAEGRRRAGRNQMANMPSGPWRAVAARDFAVSPRSVQAAANVIEHGTPELVDAVRSGSIAVSAAAVLLDLSPARQRAVFARGPAAVRALVSRMRRGLAETPRHVWGERQVVQLSGEDRVVPEPVAFTLYRGDCLKELRKLTDASVQLVVTSPPYAEARKSSYGGTHPDRYVRWFVPRAEQLRRVLRPTGSFVLVIKDSVVRGERHRYVMDLVLALRDQGWLHTETWIWHKRNCAPGKWPNRFRDAFEYVFQFNLNRRFDMYQDAVRVPVGDWARTRLNGLSETDWTQDRSKTGSKFAKNVSRWVGRNTVYPTNVVGISSECGNVGHPAAFPVALPDFFVRLFTRPGDVVLDPFAGSGTTGVAALRLGREFVGIDTREDYLTIAHERLADALAAGDESGSVGDGGNSETTMSRLARNR